jgi:hypothetical protein
MYSSSSAVHCVIVIAHARGQADKLLHFFSINSITSELQYGQEPYGTRNFKIL